MSEMPAEKMFPLQVSRSKGVAPGPLQIPWSVAEVAYGAYARLYGRGQTLERLAERGGFGWCEMDQLHPKWREEVSEIQKLRKECQCLNDVIDILRSGLEKYASISNWVPGKPPLGGLCWVPDQNGFEYAKRVLSAAERF